MDNKVIGILGGGQLGRMLIEAANRLNVKVLVLDQPANPATDLCAATDGHVAGDFRDPTAIDTLASRCTVLTTEIEHVDATALEAAAKKYGVEARPSAEVVRIIQDKFVQKCHLEKLGVPVAPYVDLEPGNEERDIRASGFGFPAMLKIKTLAYDGRGNRVIRDEKDVAASIEFLGGGASKQKPALYLEKMVPFVKEVAVMVARGADGSVASYPCVETVQKDNICHVVIAPAQIDGAFQARARRIAEQAITGLQGIGIFGVEMFLMPSGDIVLNEIAPRPHNSGHYATEACYTSQFEQHLRCVLGLPLGSAEMKVPVAGMVNILGVAGGLEETLAPCARSMVVPGATVHLYGKKESRAGRKMGHITVVAKSLATLLEGMDTILGGPGLALPPLQNTVSSKLRQAAQVGIIMGSDSDLPTLKPAAEILTRFGVPFEVTIVSAHRTPTRLVEYASSAHTRGLQVIIAAAGGAAHLPGMVAAITPLPVIGVPVALKVLDGMDSLLSIVQMPRGVPVATVAINNAVNAALLVVRILGAHVPEYRDAMHAYMKEQESVVEGKIAALEETGWEKYQV